MSKVIAVIPCREGSKRLEGKNKKELCGKPLFKYSIDLALQCHFIDEVILTTDDKDIIDSAKHYPEARLIIHDRPKYLARDDTPMRDVVVDACHDFREVNPIVILLQPTSPLREVKDILTCFQLFKENNKSICSVCSNGKLGWKPNGVVYIDRFWSIMYYGFNEQMKVLHVMPLNKSIDIDTIEDFEKCEKYLKEVDGK